MKQYSRISNQQAVVLNHIVKAGSITRREAWVDYGVSNLTAAIASLRAAQYPITMQRRIHPVTLQRYAEYYCNAVI
jgi:hypothetical protein